MNPAYLTWLLQHNRSLLNLLGPPLQLPVTQQPGG